MINWFFNLHHRITRTQIIIITPLILAFIAYILISKVWRNFETYGFPCAIALAIAIMHHIYWISNKNARVSWSITKRRVIYTITVVCLEAVALIILSTMNMG